MGRSLYFFVSTIHDGLSTPVNAGNGDMAGPGLFQAHFFLDDGAPIPIVFSGSIPF